MWVDFIKDWHNSSFDISGRDDLEETDNIWEKVYEAVIKEKEKCRSNYVAKGTLLYRVHREHENIKMPLREDFSDDEAYKSEKKYVEHLNSRPNIEFDNHWVSFTKGVDVIKSPYFESKGLRGEVIVIKADKAIDIAEEIQNCFENGVYDEKEVVAPLDKATLVEVLDYPDFIKKYK